MSSGAADHKTHGSDHIMDFESWIGLENLLKDYFKNFYTTAKTSSSTNKVSNKTRTITQIISIDEYNKTQLQIKSVTVAFRCRNVILSVK